MNDASAPRTSRTTAVTSVLDADAVAVVTGGAGGIGLAICEVLAEQGVAIACLEHPSVDPTHFSALCDHHGVESAFIEVEITDQQAVARAVGRARELGPVRYAVNAAGIHGAAPSATMPAEQWARLIDVDLSGVYYSCQAEYAAMTSTGGGSIVNIASMSGVIINHGDPSAGYFAAKAGVIHLSRALGAEWATDHVRVNAVSPGYTRTAMTAKNPDEVNAGFCRDTPMGRMAEPHEIAYPTLFLLSGAASYVTATNLAVDGGYTAW